MVEKPKGKFTTDGYKRVMHQVGGGTAKLRGSVLVNQIYAFAQHESTWLSGPNAGKRIRNHPHGGEAKYLQAPLFANYPRYMNMIADSLLNEGGIDRGMTKVVEDLAGEVEKRAPVLHWYLRHSAHPTVKRGATIVYDRPPRVHRLSKEELASIQRNRGSL